MRLFYTGSSKHVKGECICGMAANGAEENEYNLISNTILLVKKQTVVSSGRVKGGFQQIFCVYSEDAIIRASVSLQATVSHRTAGDSFSPCNVGMEKIFAIVKSFQSNVHQIVHVHVATVARTTEKQKTSFLFNVWFFGVILIWIFWANTADNTTEIL